MKSPTAKDLATLTSIASAFAQRFEQPGGGHPLVAERRKLLGPSTVFRTARALAFGRGLGERVADLGLRVESRDSASSEAALRRMNASATGCVVASALGAWTRRDGGSARVELGSRCDVAAVRAALSPIVEAGELEIREVDVEARLTRVVIAPYFYAPGDLERVAEAIALERALPSPHAEGGLDVELARGWAQRHLFRERLAAAESALGSDAVSVHEIDVDDTLELLEKARHLPKADALAAFVYPMLRERSEVERALGDVLAGYALSVVNHTPAIAWALGRAAEPVSLRVEADQRMRGVASRRAMSRRASFEAEPSIGRAVATLAWSWVG